MAPAKALHLRLLRTRALVLIESAHGHVQMQTQVTRLLLGLVHVALRTINLPQAPMTVMVVADR